MRERTHTRQTLLFSCLHVHVIPRAPNFAPDGRGVAVFRHPQGDGDRVTRDALTGLYGSPSRRLEEAEVGPGDLHGGGA